MDDPLYELALQVAGALGVDPVTLVGLFPILILIFNLIGRLIPDDETGVLGFVRKISKVLGLYLSNRITKGVSVNKVSEVVAGLKPETALPLELQEDMQEALSQRLPPLFPGVVRGTDGKFVSIKKLNEKLNEGKLESPLWVGVIALVIATLMLPGCMTMGGIQTAGQVICSRQDEARAGLILALARAESISDPVRREAAIGAINTSLAALDRCPPLTQVRR